MEVAVPDSAGSIRPFKIANAGGRLQAIARARLSMLAACFPLLFLSPDLGRAEDDRLPFDTMIVLERGACERQCPEYSIVIFRDGTVLFDGQYFVRKPGVSKVIIEPKTVKKLVEKFTAMNYFNLRDEYGYRGSGCSSIKASNEPVALTAIVMGGIGKSINHHLGCEGAVPLQLTALEDEIDKTVGALRWIK
jgi:hypothetical protein